MQVASSNLVGLLHQTRQVVLDWEYALPGLFVKTCLGPVKHILSSRCKLTTLPYKTPFIGSNRVFLGVVNLHHSALVGQRGVEPNAFTTRVRAFLPEYYWPEILYVALSSPAIPLPTSGKIPSTQNDTPSIGMA